MVNDIVEDESHYHVDPPRMYLNGNWKHGMSCMLIRVARRRRRRGEVLDDGKGSVGSGEENRIT